MTTRTATITTGLAVVVLLATACGGSSTDDPTAATTSTPAATATSDGGSEASTPTPSTTATSASAAETATADADHAEADVEAAATAAAEAADALPDYAAGTKPAEPEDEDDILFEPCLTEDDFDLDELDASTAVAIDADVEAADGTEGSLEVRAFNDEELATDAFAALQKVLGTAEGRVCFAEQLAASFGSPTPPTVEPFAIDGATVAARATATFGGSTITIDFGASRVGACTFFGSFQSIGDPFDTSVAGAMFLAATG